MPGFSGKDLKKTKQALVSAGAKVEVISQYLSPITSMEGEELIPDKHYISVSSVLYDAVYIPGGEQSIDALSHQSYVVNFVNEAFKHCKTIAGTGEAVALLKEVADPSLQEAKMALNKQDGALSDMGVVTSSVVSDEFNQAFILDIAQHRHWMREKSDNTPA